MHIPGQGHPVDNKAFVQYRIHTVFETCVQPGTFSVSFRLSDEFQSTGLSAATHPVYLFLYVLAVCFPAERQLSPRVRDRQSEEG